MAKLNKALPWAEYRAAKAEFDAEKARLDEEQNRLARAQEQQDAATAPLREKKAQQVAANKKASAAKTAAERVRVDVERAGDVSSLVADLNDKASDLEGLAARAVERQRGINALEQDVERLQREYDAVVADGDEEPEGA